MRIALKPQPCDSYDSNSPKRHHLSLLSSNFCCLCFFHFVLFRELSGEPSDETLQTYAAKFELKTTEVGRCRLTPGFNSRIRAWFQTLKPKCEQSLSAFKLCLQLQPAPLHRGEGGAGGHAHSEPRSRAVQADPGFFAVDPTLAFRHFQGLSALETDI